MLISPRPFMLRGLMSLAFLACACGDDAKQAVVTNDDNEGGAPAVAPSFPPALGPEDCATTTSAIRLSQPDGAAVWGGLTLLEFEVEGGKVDQFDVQTFDPSLAAWTNFYTNVEAQGQREDGSYFLAVSPYFSEATKDLELKFRVRPSQQGCPDADWTETTSFGAGDPLEGTKWAGEIEAADFFGQFNVQRYPIPNDTTLPSSPLTLGDASVSVDFGKKGVFTEVVTVPLKTEADAPYDGCTLSLTFSGTYQVSLRAQYGGVRLAISELTLTSIKGTACAFPAVEDMALSAKDFDVRLNAYTQQGISIDYLPTLFTDPGSPLWQNSNLAQIFQQFPSFLAYATPTETGSVNGYTNVQELLLERQ